MERVRTRQSRVTRSMGLQLSSLPGWASNTEAKLLKPVISISGKNVTAPTNSLGKPKGMATVSKKKKTKTTKRKITQCKDGKGSTKVRSQSDSSTVKRRRSSRLMKQRIKRNKIHISDLKSPAAIQRRPSTLPKEEQVRLTRELINRLYPEAIPPEDLPVPPARHQSKISGHITYGQMHCPSTSGTLSYHGPEDCQEDPPTNYRYHLRSGSSSCRGSMQNQNLMLGLTKGSIRKSKVKKVKSKIALHTNSLEQFVHSLNHVVKKDMGETSRIYVLQRKEWMRKVAHKRQISMRKHRKADAAAVITDLVESIALHHDIKSIRLRMSSLGCYRKDSIDKIDITELGNELKLCLAKTSPFLVLSQSKEGSMCEVNQFQVKWRHVPMWTIPKDDDPPQLYTQIKVKVQCQT